MSQQISNRAAWPDEYDLINRLFAPPWKPGATARWVVASTPGPRERVLAMAAVAWSSPQDGDTASQSARLYWRALPAYQANTTVVASLITHALSTTVDSHISECSAYKPLEAGSLDHEMLVELGFRSREQIEVFETSFDRAQQRCQRIYRRLEQHDRVPAAARITSFQDSLLPELRAIFHNNGIVDCLDFDARKSALHEEPMDLQRSTAIILDGRLIAALLVCLIPQGTGCIFVPGRWVASGFRKGWANAALINRTIDECVSLEFAIWRFVANSALHQETAKFAARLGGQQVKSLSRMSIPI